MDVNQAPDVAPNADYLRELVRLASDNTPVMPVGDLARSSLDLFRVLVIARSEDLRLRLLGSNVQILSALDREQRAALRTLEAWPDLLERPRIPGRFTSREAV